MVATLSLNPSATQVPLNSTVTVDLYLGGVANLAAYQLVVVWDPNVLRCEGVVATDFLPGATTGAIIDNVRGAFVIYTINSPAEGVSGNGILATATFTAIGYPGTQLRYGSSRVGDGFFDTWLTDPDIIDIPFTVQGTAITVPAPPGSPTLTVSVNNALGGTTEPAPGTYQYPVNTTALVHAIPSADWVLDHWLLDNVGQPSTNPISILMDENHAVEAWFVPAALAAKVVGTVKGLFGVKVKGAQVSVDGNTTTTTAAGTFSLNLPTGLYTFEVKKWLYETYAAPLDISSYTTYDLGTIQLSFKRAIMGAGAGIAAGIALAAILIPRAVKGKGK